MSPSEFPDRLVHFLLTQSKLDLRFVISMTSSNHCCCSVEVEDIPHQKSSSIEEEGPLILVSLSHVVWPHHRVGIQRLFTEAKSVAVPRLACHQLQCIPNCSKESWCFRFYKCAAAGVCSETVSVFVSLDRDTNTHKVDCLNLKGQNEDKTFFWPVTTSFRIESQSLDRWNQKQDGAVMIGLVASVQFSPLTDDQCFKHKGLQYPTKLLNNVFLASH